MSLGLIVAQVLLGNGDVVALSVDWLVAGIVAAGIWHVTKRYHLCGMYEGKAITISWPVMSICMNFAICYFPRMDHFYLGVIIIVAMLAVLSLVLSVWQEELSVGRHMIIGLIIGFISTLLPHTLLWLLLIPMASYHMRSWSLRNTFSVLTGTVLGIWFVYCGLFFCQQWQLCQLPISADQMLQNYFAIIQPEALPQLWAGLGLWQWLFLFLLALLVIIYSISAMLINAGNSIRAGASISLISTLSISLVVIAFLDILHLSFYISLLSLFLSIQLTIHQSNRHSAFNEWWTLVIILAMAALFVMPIVVSI